MTPDEWHHVLISLDLTDISVTNETVNSFAKLYVALDDADRKTNNTPSLISDDHGVIPGDASPRPNFSYSLSGAKIPSGGVELGVPGIAKYVGKIRDAYMAELLIFTGVTIDTSVEANRRLFITKPDKNGAKRPTNTTPLTIPMRKYAVGDPVKWEPGADWPAFAPGLLDPSGIPTVIKLNGKATIADVDFTKCQFNWQMGRNLGTSKSKVVRTGPVRAEYPDPKLTG